jgi:tetratricopeptide (TPR) repeat protein
MKFFKKSYIQQAIAEEAKGNYKQAAALYSKAEEFEKVGEMYELIGDMSRSFPQKIKAYQQAIRWYNLPGHLEPLAEKLAKTMEIEIRADAKVSPVELHRLSEVAEYYVLAKQWEKAGKIYEELGMYDKATEMYIQGGAIEQVERLAGRKEERDHRVSTAQQYYEDALSYYKVGQRDRAYQAIKQCVSLDTTHPEAQSLSKALNQALQPTDVRRIRISTEESEYIVFGKNKVTIGRKEDNDIVLMRTDVSRYHACIGLRNQTVIVEDLHSSNGTRLNGLRIQKTAIIHSRDVIGIGPNAQFEAYIQQRSSGISASIRPLDTQEIQKRYILFSGEILIGSDSECELHLQPLVPSSSPYLFKMKYQPPYWYLYIHPHVTDVEFNGNPVTKYVVVTARDSVTTGGITLLFD